MESKKPIQKFRNGAISVDIWANNTDNGVLYTITTQKVYKNEKGEWQTTNNLNATDALKLSHLLNLASDWVVQQ